MTFQELKKRCENRNFDQIVVLVKDIFAEMAEMRRIMGAAPGDVRVCTDKTDAGLVNAAGPIAYTERRATFFYENTAMCIVQPVEGDTLYQKYMDKYGEGICCVRERIPAADYAAMVESYTKKGYAPVQTMENDTCKKAWFDFSAEFGGLFEIISDDSAKIVPSYVNPDKIQQINVTTPDVEKTIEIIADLLEIGPWELGKQNKKTVRNHAFRNNGVLDPEVDFEFVVAILPCGNIEWEAIQPLKGPLVYNDYIERHGVGYHHILVEVPVAEWQNTFTTFANNNIGLACKGSVGPVDWCYMDTEKELKFYTEMRTDAPMTKLPDGYFMKFYPAEEA